MPKDGDLVKTQSSPEVFVIQHSQRHWIPDEVTLKSRWSWSQVQVLPDNEVYQFRMGDPIPSLADAQLVRTLSDATVYYVVNGIRHSIPDPATFSAMGFSPNQVKVVALTQLHLIPLGDPIKSAGAYADPGTYLSPRAYYKMIAMHSDKCLEVSGGPGAVSHDGAHLQQAEYLDADNQKWRFQDAGGGYYKIVAKNSVKGLDVKDGVMTDGAEVHLWDYHGKANQKWQIRDVGGGAVAITAGHSGKCLEVAGGPSAIANGARIQQWEYVPNNNNNQKWKPIALEIIP
jgi:Ricin-type beta-trefoil lectin domain-like